MNSWVSCLPRVSACPALRIATLSLLIKSDRFVARSQLLAPSLPPQCCKLLSIELVYELSAHSNKFKKEARSLCVCVCVCVCVSVSFVQCLMVSDAYAACPKL